MHYQNNVSQSIKRQVHFPYFKSYWGQIQSFYLVCSSTSGYLTSLLVQMSKVVNQMQQTPRLNGGTAGKSGFHDVWRHWARQVHFPYFKSALWICSWVGISRSMNWDQEMNKEKKWLRWHWSIWEKQGKVSWVLSGWMNVRINLKPYKRCCSWEG